MHRYAKADPSVTTTPPPPPSGAQTTQQSIDEFRFDPSNAWRETTNVPDCVPGGRAQTSSVVNSTFSFNYTSKPRRNEVYQPYDQSPLRLVVLRRRRILTHRRKILALRERRPSPDLRHLFAHAHLRHCVPPKCLDIVIQTDARNPG